MKKVNCDECEKSIKTIYFEVAIHMLQYPGNCDDKYRGENINICFLCMDIYRKYKYFEDEYGNRNRTDVRQKSVYEKKEATLWG